MYKGMKKHANIKEKENNSYTKPGFELVNRFTNGYSVLRFNHLAKLPSFHFNDCFVGIYILSEFNTSF